MVWGGRREEGSGWGTHVYLWWIHFDIWQNQHNIVKLKNKIKIKNTESVTLLKKKKRKKRKSALCCLDSGLSAGCRLKSPGKLFKKKIPSEIGCIDLMWRPTIFKFFT